MIALACTVVMTGCGNDDDGGEVALTDITVSPSSVSLLVGGTQKVTATPVPANAAGVSFVWTSQNESVATVDQTGLVTVRSEGTTTVTVSSGNISKQVPVEGTVERIPLVSINVSEETVTLPVGDSVTIVPTPVPANATAVEYTWSSNDETVATVDQTGKIKITGVGTAEITVASGSVNKKIAVTGTIKSLTVVDENGDESSIVNLGDKLQLSVVIVPDNTGLTPDSWSSNNETVATVDATGEVTVTGLGTASITAVVNGKEASYTVSTLSLFDDAYGYWTFDDPEQLGKATKGSDLTVNGTVNIVDGPSESNIAIEGTKGEHNLEWQHQKAESPRQFTMMFDTRFFGIRQYYALYWNGRGNQDACWFFRWRDSSYKYDDGTDGETKPVLQAGRGDYYYVMDLAEGDTTQWMRVVITIEVSDADDQIIYSTFVDGRKVITAKGAGAGYRFDWDTVVPVYFLSDGEGSFNDGDDNPQPVAAIAVWDRLLTDDEVASLGRVR